MAHDPSKREQIIKLKDGRTIFKTHNGFRSFVEDRKGKISPIFPAQYLKFKKHRENGNNQEKQG